MRSFWRRFQICYRKHHSFPQSWDSFWKPIFIFAADKHQEHRLSRYPCSCEVWWICLVPDYHTLSPPSLPRKQEVTTCTANSPSSSRVQLRVRRCASEHSSCPFEHRRGSTATIRSPTNAVRVRWWAPRACRGSAPVTAHRIAVHEREIDEHKSTHKIHADFK